MNNPNLVIRTERLILRPYIEEDYSKWLEGYQNRLPKKYKYDLSSPSEDFLSRINFMKRVERFFNFAVTDQIYIWGIFLLENGKNIGTLDIATIRRADNQWANLGYYVHNQFWRNGYGAEAVTGALKQAFSELCYNRIEAAINPDNIPSIGLVKKAGMIYEGIRRGFIYENGAWNDHHIYAAIPSDLGLKTNPPATIG